LLLSCGSLVPTRPRTLRHMRKNTMHPKTRGHDGLNHNLIARISSPRSGYVVDKPFLSRVTCSTRLSMSARGQHVNPHALPTRAAHARHLSNSQRGRAASMEACLSATSMSFSTSTTTRCLRIAHTPFIQCCGHLKNPVTPATARGIFSIELYDNFSDILAESRMSKEL
jgi:hypothetical protein